ncbi:charybde-like, partial [Asbolus verrucosus]
CNYDLFSAPDDRGLCLTIPSLTHRIESELRSAKRTHLSCGEVLLPCGLLHRISRDILSMAESEPCGIRGCLIYVNFDALDECRKLSSVKCDPGTATTFELNLTLKQNSTGWNFIPQFLKNLARGGTIVVSPAYVLSKKKLYRSILE